MPRLTHRFFCFILMTVTLFFSLPAAISQTVQDDPLIPLPEIADPLTPSSLNYSAGQRRLPVDRTVGAEIVDDESGIPAPRQNQDALSVGAEIVDDVLIPSTPHRVTNSEPVDPSQTQISVLGYHDFSQTKSPTRMRMMTAAFRAEMQKIRNSGATVISMDDMVAWKKGEKKLPAHCVLITLDDGWKSVYTDAFPILKEYGYPFTLFLYTDYIDNGGSTLTLAMIREMLQNGASIGSHSVSHPYPKDYRKQKSGRAEKYAAFLTRQIGDSKRILEEKLGVKVNAYCYPGGYKTQEMYDILTREGYALAFDVIAGKTTVQTHDHIIPRYMVIGTELHTFDGAVKFGIPGGKSSLATVSSASPASSAQVQAGPVPSQVVTPAANSQQTAQCQPVSINMATAGNFDPNNIVMRVSGFGRVPGLYEAETKTYKWTPNRPLRGRINVSVTWAAMGSKEYCAPVEWGFEVSEIAVEPPPTGWIP